MSASRDRQIVIELVVRSGHPGLLAGLDAWLQLGLISDDFVRQLSEAELSCALPAVVPVAPLNAAEVAEIPTVATVALEKPRRRPQPNLLSQALQAFMAEISVVWLLFLGVFLVVVSSGVLAATQWQNFSLLGQYGILLAYTVAFAIASLAARSRPVLQLTSRMLTIATLLLIPVNFWMMDGFQLWRQAGGLGLIAIAAVSLTGIIMVLLRRSESRLLMAVVVLLSWLHWGWHQPGIPLIATYVGTLGATAALLVQDRQRRQLAPVISEADPATSPAERSPAQPTGITAIAIALAATLLIGRALFAAQVPIQQLGLAIAGCGWLLGWLARRDRTRWGWSRASTVLMVLGWLVTVGETPPWQAIAISGLGLQLLYHALWQTGRAAYLVAGFGVGGQLLWLGWRVFPSTWQTQVVAWASTLSGSIGMPDALLGLGFFPYVLVTAGFALYLRRRDRDLLARVAEGLALALGTGLVVVSWGNPLVRSLTLTLASLTLLGVVRDRRPLPAELIYLTHGTLLASLLVWVDQWLPTLPPQQWVIVLLLVLALHWGYSALRPLRWEWEGKTSWHFGLVLAVVSYALLWDLPPNLPPLWPGSWLVTPMLLTALSCHDRFPVARLAGWLSVLALLLIQPLVFAPSNLRLASLTIATLLMLANTQKLQKLPAAILTVGFGLGLWTFTLWEIGRSRLTFDGGLVLIAGTVLLMWGIWGWYQSRRSHVAQLYRMALDGWAIAVFLLACLLISVGQFLIWLQPSPGTWSVVCACGLLVLATSYRTWQTPTPAGWFAIAGSLELLTVSSLLLAGRSLPALVIANIGLGFLAQIVGNRALGRRRAGVRRQELGRERQGDEDTPVQISTHLDYPLSWHLIPLIYGGLALWLAHLEFTATTGLYTLAIAILGCQIGRRSPRLEVITVLSLVGLSWGAFELLTYQLSVAKGGNLGDGITLLAGLAILLTWLYHGGRRPLGRWLRLVAVAFDQFVQVHWVLGTMLLGVAVVSSISRTGQSLWTAIAVGHAAYALVISRSGSPVVATSRRMRQAWLYAGIWQLLAAIASAFWLLLPTGMLIDWAGAIAAGLAVLLYRLPWQRWGWVQDPGQQSAAGLPGVVLLLTGWGANLQSLLLAAAYYAWFATVTQNIRFSYVSVLLADWALIRLLLQFNLTHPLWYAAIAGGSILYLAQVDPALQTQERYEQRHWVRSLATALVCLTGFYQAEVGITGLSPFVAGFVAIAIEFGFILWGLVQRVRAFLYVGTLSFMLQILWQLWRFMRDYSLVLWLVGIVVGLLLIWVAATFEARRTQANALLQQWVTELEAWQ